MMKKYCCSANTAMRIAIEYAGLGNCELCCAAISAQDGLFAIRIDTDFMRYEFYVDVENKETLGFNSEPLDVSEPEAENNADLAAA